MDRLGLTDDELCLALAADPLSDLGRARPQARAADPARAHRGGRRARGRRRAAPLGALVRALGRPLDHLLARDFAAFEDDLQALADRGFVLRGGMR